MKTGPKKGFTITKAIKVIATITSTFELPNTTDQDYIMSNCNRILQVMKNSEGFCRNFTFCFVIVAPSGKKYNITIVARQGNDTNDFVFHTICRDFINS